MCRCDTRLSHSAGAVNLPWLNCNVCFYVLKPIYTQEYSFANYQVITVIPRLTQNLCHNSPALEEYSILYSTVAKSPLFNPLWFFPIFNYYL